jgi:hypothetical protein
MHQMSEYYKKEYNKLLIKYTEVQIELEKKSNLCLRFEPWIKYEKAINNLLPHLKD